jgi:hypothetical protein
MCSFYKGLEKKYFLDEYLVCCIFLTESICFNHSVVTTSRILFDCDSECLPQSAAKPMPYNKTLFIFDYSMEFSMV